MGTYVIALLVFAASLPALAQDYDLEEAAKRLPPVPLVIASEVNPKEQLDPQTCEYVGQRVKLGASRSVTHWLVVSRTGCDWYVGGPTVYFVEDSKDGQRVLLNTAEKYLSILKHRTHGLRDLAIGQDGTPEMYRGHYRYDGKAYVYVPPKSSPVVRDFNLEGLADGLPLVPKALALVVNPDAPSSRRPCEYVGERVDLGASQPVSHWLVISRTACDWAAGAPAAYLVEAAETGYRTVLSVTTTSVSVLKDKTNGLRDIGTVRLMARGVEGGLYQYNGKEYLSVPPRGAQKDR